MKATELETKKFDKALDEILDLFNNLENDDPIIHFGDDVIENIERAKKKYGDETVDERINTVVREMLSWLDLESVDLEEDEQKGEEEDET
ncbi:atypical membrane-integrating protein (Mistic protein) [Halobacillus shinanisalinarum]|uniref:Atypical membrane-integrating protein (Mistic protein) n=1 Tax=Halobacillus shinanisalinarum TaxID=2932258 RepID=A0ABY4GW26_9BACI|nr:atypical membrane-integrating protein (Mistic protein) [Halobacillus shinanisalinarum]UOQ92191.1 atypical membrane-integrating protein (Mistic protein) [Halobacillus shinanisalinarum]